MLLHKVLLLYVFEELDINWVGCVCKHKGYRTRDPKIVVYMQILVIEDSDFSLRIVCVSNLFMTFGDVVVRVVLQHEICCL